MNARCAPHLPASRRRLFSVARSLLVLVLMASAGSPTSRAQQDVGELLEQKAVAKLHAYADAFDGVIGMAAIDLATGRTFSVNGDSVFAQASSIKIPLLIQAFRAAKSGELRLDAPVTLTKEDIVGGAGNLKTEIAKHPVTLTVRELLVPMIQFSDNTATNKCIALVGMQNVNAFMAELGLRQTRLQRVMLDTSGAAERDRENISTPLEMARLVEMLYRGKFEGSPEMIELLKLVDRGWQLPDGGFRGAIPAEVPIAAKPGSVRGVQCETGVVFLANRPFVLSVMAVYVTEGRTPVSDVTKIVYSYFKAVDSANSYGNKVR